MNASQAQHRIHCITSIKVLLVVLLCSLASSLASAAQSFTPGNYVFVSDGTFDEMHVGDFLSATTTYNGQTVNAFRGVQRTYYWKDLEPDWYHNYTWTKVDQDIAYLKNNYPGRKLAIQFSYKCWTAGPNDYNFPDYIKDNKANGVNGAGPYGDPANGGSGVGYYVALGMNNNYHPYIWNTAVQARMKEVLEALYQHLVDTNNLDVLECINMCESSDNFGTGPNLCTSDVWGDASKTNMLNMKNAFPNIWVFQYANFPKDQMVKWADFNNSNGIGWGGPDVAGWLNNAPAGPPNHPEEETLNGSPSSPGTYAYYCNFWQYPNVTAHVIGDKQIKGAAVQNPDYNWDIAETGEYNYGLAKDRLQLNYLFWQAQYSTTRNSKIINLVKGKVNSDGLAGGLNTTPPGPPANVNVTQITPGDQSISFTWTNPTDSDFDRVKICRSSTGWPTLQDAVYTTTHNQTSWTDSGLTNGVLYYYKFFAFDDGSPVCYASGVGVSETPGDTAPPAAISGLTATSTGTGNEINLTWSKPNPLGDYVGVMIRRKAGGYPTSISDGTLICNSTGTSFLDNNGVVDGTTYYYRGFAYDAIPNYNLTQVVGATEATGVSADTVAPAKITGLTAVSPGTGNKINLSWTNPVTADYAGVMIRRKAGSYPTSTTDGTLIYDSNGTSCSDTNAVVDGTTYYYRSFSHDEVPNYNVYQSADTETTGVSTDTTAPAVPTGLAATPAVGQISLDWNDNTEADLSGYNLYRTTTAGSGYAKINGALLTSSSYVDGSLTGGVTYYYKVTSVDDASNESSDSSPVSSVPRIFATFIGEGANDGWVLESGETTNVGGSTNSTDTSTGALKIGDDTGKKQYKAIVSFDTYGLPDTATITAATLKIKRGTSSNTPSALGTIWADINTYGLGGDPALQNNDFQAGCSVSQAAQMSYPSSNGTVSSGSLNQAGRNAICLDGRTQFRIYFNTDDNNDSKADYLGFYSGENGTSANRPVLEITYY